MSDETVAFDTKSLDNIIRLIKQQNYIARVGILGVNNTRPKDTTGSTNAEIGAAHEYGAPARNLPQRSFLRVPIEENLSKALENSARKFDEDTLKQAINDGNFSIYVRKIAIEAVAVVLTAFKTGGYGKWPALNPKTLAQKETKQILVESRQLRDSIDYDVKKVSS